MKKYYADIKLLFDESKYGIVGDSSVGKKDMVDLPMYFMVLNN